MILKTGIFVEKWKVMVAGQAKSSFSKSTVSEKVPEIARRVDLGCPRSNSETLLNSVNSKIVFLDFFEALCSVVLWSKYRFFQTMHKQKVIFCTFCCNAFVTFFYVLLRLSVYRYFDQNHKFFNSSINRKPYFQFFLSSHFFDHWRNF